MDATPSAPQEGVTPGPGRTGGTGAPAGHAIDTNRLSRSDRNKAIRERRRQVWELKIRGATLEAIAKAVGISKAAVCKHLKRAGEDVAAETKAHVETYIAQEVALTEALIQSLFPRRADPRVADTILRASEYRARLRGADKPQRVEVSGPGGRPIQSQSVGVTFDPTKLGTDDLRRLMETLSSGLVQAPEVVESLKPSNVVALPARSE